MPATDTATEATPSTEAASDTPTESGPDSKPKGRPTTREGRAAKTAARNKAKADARPSSGTSYRRAPLKARLNSVLVTVGGVTTASGAMTGSQPLMLDGIAVQAHAAELTDALDKLADNDPRVRDALERMLSAGAYGGLLAAVLPLVVTILANHGVVPNALSQALDPVGAAAVATVPAPPGGPPAP